MPFKCWTVGQSSDLGIPSHEYEADDVFQNLEMLMFDHSEITGPNLYNFYNTN